MYAVQRALLIALGVAAAVSSAPPGAHAAPSFDCRRASSVVEKELCGVPELGDLDRGIATLFTQALAVLNTADAGALRAEQRTWLHDRDDCGDLIHGDPPIMADVYGCLRQQMTARATRLRAIIARKQFFK